MDDHRSSVPWNTRALWREANTSLATTVRQNRPGIAESRRQARQIKRLLESTFPHMDRLCRRTCPDCTDACCQRAWVWADFKDLLFLHLAGIPAPGRQLLDPQGGHCRYEGPAGCRLERIRRPFVCTWYLCPAQTQRLRKEPAEMQVIQTSLRQIKALRQGMERSFIWAVT
ncbi:MAG: hypothetical protein KQI81_17365 [Deltaproteobacteria bacterium]|nr:hypothetical protein [Deltaproteobacteria bacterium]